MKKQITHKQLIAEIAGWYGALAILAGYTLVSLKLVQSDSLVFQLLNLTGAIGIIIIAIYKRVPQTIVLNVVWIIVALIAIGSIIANHI